MTERVRHGYLDLVLLQQVIHRQDQVHELSQNLSRLVDPTYRYLALDR